MSECFLHAASFRYIVLACEHSGPHARYILTANVLRGIHFTIINNSHPRIFARFRLIQLRLLNSSLLLICLFLASGHWVSFVLPFLQLNLSLCFALPLLFRFLLHFFVQHSLSFLVLLFDLFKQLKLLFSVVFGWSRWATESLRHVWSCRHTRQTGISENVILAHHLDTAVHCSEALICRWEGLLLREVCKIVHFLFYNYK